MSTREAILTLADNLIRSKGYHAFSYRDIATQLDIKNAAVHYHFAAKADLGAAVIRRDRETLTKAVESWQGLSVDKQLDRFLSLYESMSRLSSICIIGALAPFYKELPEVMKRELSQLMEQAHAALERVLQTGLDEQKYSFEETAGQKSTIIIRLLMASLISGRVSGEKSLKPVIRMIKQSL